MSESAKLQIPKRYRGPLSKEFSGRPQSVIFRSLVALKTSAWYIVLSGFFEPVFYLFAFGLGVGQLIDGVTGPAGQPVSYAAFLAPALLATSAMNGAFYDSTWNVFFKMRFGKIYEGMVATSLGPMDVALGEIIYALMRGLIYSAGFVIIMYALGLVLSPWGILALPGALLIAFGFSACGMAVTSYLKNFQEMDWLNFIMLPMFLFSATFYPITLYPEPIQYLIKFLPLWHGVEMIRAFTIGPITFGVMGHIAYFMGMILLGLTVTTRRLTKLFMA
jgi:lipooligosaccharide transport system permease protein